MSTDSPPSFDLWHSGGGSLVGEAFEPPTKSGPFRSLFLWSAPLHGNGGFRPIDRKRAPMIETDAFLRFQSNSVIEKSKEECISSNLLLHPSFCLLSCRFVVSNFVFHHCEFFEEAEIERLSDCNGDLLWAYPLERGDQTNVLAINTKLPTFLSAGVKALKVGESFNLLLMGICLSAKPIAGSDNSTGVKSSKADSDGSNGKDNGSASSKISLASVLPAPRSEGEISQSSNLKSFPFAELKEATRNFCPDSVLGEPVSGSVFKGWIDEHSFTATKPGTGMVIAVKRINQDTFRGHGEWLAEVNFLGQLVHSHLVKLVGYCVEDEQQLLVNEFMPRGSLENHLFLRGSYFQPLSWSLRLKVALGAAKGLAFLHSEKRKVIYCDLRTSNILLDSDYNAKLSDLGFAKDTGAAGGKANVSTRITGTGTSYAAPEYLATGQATTSSAVYSFGVILLEMLSGRRAIDKNRPFREHNLIEWATPYLANKRKTDRIIDDRLEGQYSLDAAYKVSSLALQCLSNEPKSRPSMNVVVTELEQLQDSTSINSNRNSTQNRRARRHSADDAKTLRSARAYPWPPVSPVYT